MYINSPLTIERALHMYSVDVSEWADGVGDTDQTLGVREWLEARASQLTGEQTRKLHKIDEQVVHLAKAAPADAKSWDLLILGQLRDLVTRYQRASRAA